MLEVPLWSFLPINADIELPRQSAVSVSPMKCGVILFLIAALVACNRQATPSTNVAETGSRMSLLIEQHRFEEAAQLGLHSVTGKTADAAIYYFVALAYAEQAKYENGTIDSSLKRVDEYSRRSVSLDPDNQLNRFNIAWVLEYAGDVNSTSRCKYYADSKELLREASSEVSADIPLKNQVALSTSRVIQKSRNAHCR
jgi:hypothetical protein